MGSVSDLRARIASGEVKFGGGGGKGVGEGTFLCAVESAEYARGNNGNPRGAIKCKVLSGVTDKDIGGKFSIYLQTIDAEYAEKLIAEWSKVCECWAIPEDKLYDDADSLADILNNICMQINKKAQKTDLRLLVERVKQDKCDPKSGKPYHYNNIKDVSMGGAKAEEAPAPAAPAAPVAPTAPAAAPAADAPVVKKKVWSK